MYSSDEIDIVNNFKYDKIAEIIIKYGSLVKFNAGELVYYFDDDAEGIYYVKSGKLRGFYSDKNGEEQTVIVIAGGLLLGEDTFTTPPKRVLSIDAVEPSVLYYIEREKLLDICMNDREAVCQLLALVTKKIVIFLNGLSAVQQYTAKKKLALYILQMCVASTNILNFSHERIAALIGVSRVKVSKLLSEFGENGYIKVGYRQIELINREGLLSILNE